MRIALVGSYCAANEWCAASRIPAAPTTNATRNANLIFIVIPLEANLTPRASGGPGRASIGQRAENFRSPLRANRASDSRQPLVRRVARRAAFRDDQADRGHRSTAADRRRTLVRRAQTTSAGEMTHQMGAAVTCRPSARWMMRSKLRGPARGAMPLSADA